MGTLNNAVFMVMLLNNKKMSRKELAEKLEVDVRQVSRYKEALCNAGIPIVEERGRYGGYYLEKTFLLQNVELSGDELKAIQLAVNLSTKGSFPLKEDLDSASAKIMAINNETPFFDSKATVTLDRRTNRVICNRKQRWLHINKHIVEKRKLKIKYSNINDEIMYRIVHPYGIFVYEGANYLVAFCEFRKKVRNFKLARIEEIISLDETFNKRNFDINKYVGHRLGIYCDNKGYILKLKINYPYAKCFTEHLWLDGESIEDHKDKGYIIYSGIVVGKIDTVKWILEMGKDVEVLEPKEIRDEVILEINEIIKKYQ